MSDLDRYRNPYKVPAIVAVGVLAFLFFVSDCFKLCS